MEVAEPLLCHHMVAMLYVLERTMHSCIPKQFAKPSWCRTLLAISRSEFVVPPMGLDQQTKLYTASGGKWVS